MSKKPIKSSLFRFVTLRGPQAIDDKENKPGLVFPSTAVKGDPDATPAANPLSAYYAAAQGAADEPAREAALSNLVFIPIASKTEIKKEQDPATNLKPTYEFSTWLMRNKDYMTYASVASNLAIPSDGTYTDISLSDVEEAQIWDNLLYQTINKNSVRLRETFIQVLIANKFLKQFNAFHQAVVADLGEGEVVDYAANEEKFKNIAFDKLANASVVIEKEVMLSSKVNDVTPTDTLPKSTVEYLENNLDIALRKERIASYEQALIELEREEVLFNRLKQEDFESKLATHQQAVVDEYALKEDVDLATGEKTYPNLALPEFNYTPLTADFQETSGEVYSKSSEDPSNLVSNKSLELLKNDRFELYKDFSALRGDIRKKITEEQLAISKVPTSGKKQVTVGGTTFTISPADLVSQEPYCFAGRLELTILSDLTNKFVITVIVATDRTNPYITNGTGSLTNPGGSNVIAIPGGSLIKNDEIYAVYRFFLPDNAVNEVGNWDFSATLEFANGDSVDINATLFYHLLSDVISNRMTYPFNGCGMLTNGSTGNPNNSVTAPTFYGVTNLGIADFRRVEQTVCCYVPGEVSHVENILASEYKEKSTRSFVSSETTVEQTRESEVENLSDTTSTERNEMSSEASSVIDEQRSKDRQANASVSGEKFGINYTAGFGTNSSASTSTSNSTSQAQNYAQEVTERALERVVKKVSSKRTSRVLREFEENNTHGFDNTKGKNHITGIYRWIDKIYENQIVNYGKRLTYEFAIPEPSRFLKDALYKKADTGANPDLDLITPVKPTHPTELTSFDISGAADITESNYQIIASEYNAIVNAPLDEYVRVGKTFIKEEKEYDAFGQGSEIDLPSDYIAVSGDVLWSAIARQSSDTYMSIKLGNTRQKLVGLTNNITVHYNFTDGYVGSIPFALYFNLVHSGSFSVSIKCKRSQEAYKTWQDATYNAILDAYQDRLQEYNDFQLSQQDISLGEDGARIKFNPGFNRKMEQRELKKYAIELLTKSTDIVVSKDNFADSSGSSEINADSSFAKHTEVVKFFEQAYEWDLMSYQLYPYYYSNKASWEKLISEKEDGDPIFQAFLQSGMARVVVPVRSGFESAVNWYQATGEIWNGEGLVSDINDDLYLSVVEEMLETPGEPVGDPWKTQVPTSLTIVQARSAELLQGGLPCHEDCGEASQFGESTLIISGADGSNAANGVGADIIGTDNDVA